MPKKSSAAASKKRKPPSRMTVRKDAAIASRVPTAVGLPRPGERLSLRRRISRMDGTHVLAGAAAAGVGNFAGVVMVGKGWVKPKMASGILIGTGTATATTGYLVDSDYLLVTGTGVAAAGALSLSTQLAVDGYTAVEQRAKKKRAEDSQKKRTESDQNESEKSAQDKKKARNAQPQLQIVAEDHESYCD